MITEVESFKSQFGNEHPDTLKSMFTLARTYHLHGQLEEAEKLYVQVLEARKRVLGEDHPDTLKSMDRLVRTYFVQGRLDDAAKLREEIAEARKRAGSGGDERTLGAINYTTVVF